MSKPAISRTTRLLLVVALVCGLVAAPSLVLASSSATVDEPAPMVRLERSDAPPPADVTEPSATAGPSAPEPFVVVPSHAAALPPGEVPAVEGEAPDADAARAAETRGSDRPQTDRPRLGCEVQRSDSGPVVGCRWTEAGPDRADGYRLLRAIDDRSRAVIFRTQDLTQNGYRDGEVGAGHQYHYAVQYLAEDGGVLATSAPAHVRIPGDEPRPERLRLACETVESDVERGAVVGCKWSQASNERLAGYRLIRRDAEGREVIARGGTEFTTHRDRASPGRYAYRVVGVDSDGRVIAASEPVGVHVPRPTGDPADRRTELRTDERPDRQPPAEPVESAVE